MMASLATKVASLALPSCVMTASGTSGHGDELSAYGDLSELGAVVVKSLSPFAHPGNRAPRVATLPVGMLNSVGLQGEGLDHWIAEELPRLRKRGARVVVSVWGRSIEDYEACGEALAGVDVDAIEVNVSCPNVEDRSRMFAHSAQATHDAVLAVGRAGAIPRWAKLSPNTFELPEIAAAAAQAGAEAITAINTVLGMSIDIEQRRLRLGAGGGGLSGPAIHNVAVRAVFECAKANPGLAIVGVGGIHRGIDAIELLMAGACAVQVGTASFVDPRAPWRIAREITTWMESHAVGSISELIGTAHG